MSPPEHGSWPHSPVASDFCLWGGRGVATSSRGEGRALLRQATQQKESPPPQAPSVYKVRAAPRIPSLKLGRKWGRGGGGDKGAGCSAPLKFKGPDSSPGRPRLALQPPTLVPSVRGRGTPPGSGAPAGRVRRGLPGLCAFASHSRVAQEINNFRCCFLTAYYASGTVPDPLCVLAYFLLYQSHPSFIPPNTHK